MGKRRRRRSLRPRREQATAPPVRVGGPPRFTPAADAAPPPTLTDPVRPSTITPPVIKLSRAERRRLQKRRQRQRRGSVVGAVVVLGALIAGLVVYQIAKGGDDNKAGLPVRTQSTLLLQIRGVDGKAAASALLAHDTKAKQGVMLLLPSRVIANIPGRGSGPFGNAVALGNAALSQATLTDLIGVTVDGSIVFDAATFAKFVNNLGGVTANVDTDVVSRDRNGRGVVLVPRGDAQKLDGVAANAYATYESGGQLAQLPRVQQVLEGILAKLPTPTKFLDAQRALGTGSQLTMSPARASELLSGLSADSLGNQLDVRSLDVKAVDTGGGASAFILDAPEVKKFVVASLAQSIPEGLLSGDNRVLVKNGIGTPLLGTTTRSRLLKAGFVYVDGGNVPGFPQRNSSSVVLIFNGSQAARDRGAKVAAALGLPATDVQISTLGQSVADIIVILGRDYKK